MAQGVTIVFFIAAFFVGQQWLSGVAGQKIMVESIRNLKPDRNISKVKITDSFNLDGSSARSYTEVRSAGKRNQYLSLTVYFTAPFSSQPSNFSQYWFGMHFEKEIESDLSQSNKQQIFKAFYDSAATVFKTFDFSEITYFSVLPPSDALTAFRQAIQSNQAPQKVGRTVILMPRTNSFQKSSGPTLIMIFITFGIGLLLMTLCMTFTSFNQELYRQQKKGVQPTQLNPRPYLHYLVPKHPHLVTTILIEINVLVFLVMVFNGVDVLHPSGSELLHWGANQQAKVLNGDWWRLLTSTFIHGGIAHLVFNMFGLVLAAYFIESKFNYLYFSLLYLGSGLGGNIASVLWHRNAISVGASGAIFGLCGATVALPFTNIFDKKARKALLVLMGGYVLVNLLWGLTRGADNTAHIGGLLSGAFLSLLFLEWQKK